MDEEVTVKCSNYIGDTIDDAKLLGMKGILFIGHIGKFVKLAAGVMNTHSRQADCRMEVLAVHAALEGADSHTVRSVMDCVNTSEALRVLKECGLLEKVMESVMERIEFYLTNRAGEALDIAAVVFQMKKGFWGKPRKQTVCLSRQVVLSGKRKEDKEAMKGKFTGVGVGPGDPQLLTLKALHAIQESDVVAIPVSDSGLKKPGENADPKYMQQCTAYQIVRQVYSQIGEKR